MKIVIFGCGKIGTTIISSLTGEGHDIIAMDKDPSVVEEITNLYDVMGLCGNGVDSDTLSEAGMEDAELFVAVTGSDELNMLACFLARKMGAKHTIARIRTPEYNDQSLGFMKQHLNISIALNPDLLAAHEIFNVLTFPSAVKVETFSGRNLEIVELIVKADSALAGMKLIDIRKKYTQSFLVCVVTRDDKIFIPDGNFEIRVGDRIGITASHSEIQKLLKNMQMPQKLPKTVMILGASRITYYLAKMLDSAGAKVKIVDVNKEICEEFSNRVSSSTLIVGDGMKAEVLLEEGLCDADAYVTLTGSDEVNVLSAFLASGQNVPTVVAKVNRPELAQMAEKLGLECVISPQKSASNVLSSYARALHNSIGSNVETLYKLSDGKAEVLEFNVRGDFKYVEIPLREMTLKPNVLIAGIIRGKKPIIPSGNDTIMPGDKVIVIAAGHVLCDLSDIIAKEGDKK